MPADILLYAVIAAGLVVWLRNLLGTRRDDEPQRPNPFISPPAGGDTKSRQSAAASSQSGGVANVVRPGFAAGNTDSEHLQTMINNLDRNMAVDGDAAMAGLTDIMRSDRTFDLVHFLRGSQDAFVMIVEAFAEGDKDALSELLSPTLYKAFEKVIDERAAKEEKSSMEIHAVRRAEVVDAALRDGTAYITVKFTADETNILRDKNDEILSGNPDRVTETIDIWTFGRDIRSRDPSWLLYETREEDVPEEEE